jgi:hypothetical protein
MLSRFSFALAMQGFMSDLGTMAMAQERGAGPKERFALGLQLGDRHPIYMWSMYLFILLVLIAGNAWMPKTAALVWSWLWIVGSAVGIIGMIALHKWLRQYVSARYMWISHFVQVAAIVLCLPTVTLAQPVNCKSLADNCGALTSAHVIQQPSSGIRVIGKTADGKYNVYDLQVPAEGQYLKGNTKYSENQVLDALAAVDKADVDTKLNCDFGVVCKTRAGQVVGVVPAYKALREKEVASKAKRQ